MTTWSRSIALMVALTLLLGGPLAPMVSAQQPAAPAQTDVMQEALKASARTDLDKSVYDVGAGVANVFVVPGKAILCAMGGAVGLALMMLTFGSAYKSAADLGREGCGGKWVVTGDDLRPDPPRNNAFEWEARMEQPQLGR